MPLVAADSDLSFDRNLAEKRQAEFFRLLARTATSEDVAGHVLDDAENRNLHLIEHADGFDRVEQRDFLRRTHHDGTG